MQSLSLPLYNWLWLWFLQKSCHFTFWHLTTTRGQDNVVGSISGSPPFHLENCTIHAQSVQCATHLRAVEKYYWPWATAIPSAGALTHSGRELEALSELFRNFKLIFWGYSLWRLSASEILQFYNFWRNEFSIVSDQGAFCWVCGHWYDLSLYMPDTFNLGETVGYKTTKNYTEMLYTCIDGSYFPLLKLCLHVSAYIRMSQLRIALSVHTKMIEVHAIRSCSETISKMYHPGCPVPGCPVLFGHVETGLPDIRICFHDERWSNEHVLSGFFWQTSFSSFLSANVKTFVRSFLVLWQRSLI